MENDMTSVAVARLLQENGFTQSSKHYFIRKDDRIHFAVGMPEENTRDEFPAYTRRELFEYIRGLKNHEIHIYPDLLICKIDGQRYKEQIGYNLADPLGLIISQHLQYEEENNGNI